MTYMWPNYYTVPMVNQSRLAFKYRLMQYAHKELNETERNERPPKVLVFVPGSAGSGGQVRSIGKEVMDALQARGQARTAIAIYTLDFAEEPSALSGLFLEDQAEFLKDALRVIGEAHNQPEVVLFAHSMGGVVSRMVLAAADDADPALFRIITPENASSSAHASADKVIEAGDSDSVIPHTFNDTQAAQQDYAADAEARDGTLAKANADPVIIKESEEIMIEKVSEGLDTNDRSEVPDADEPGETLVAKNLESTAVEVSDEPNATESENLDAKASGDIEREVNSEANENEEALVKQEVAVRFIALYTLSTPHREPVVGVDMMMWDLYSGLSSAQDDSRVYLSLAGGYRDALMPGGLAQLDRKQYPRSASTLTSALPDVKLSTDHLAILWCNEVVKRLANHVVEALEGEPAAVLHSPGLKGKRIPRVGYSKEEAKALGPPGGDFGDFWVDVMARKYVVCVLPGMFASMVLLVLAMAGMPTKEVAILVAALAAVGAALVSPAAARPLDLRVMCISFSSGAGLAGLMLLFAQIFFRWSRMIVGWAPQLLGASILTAKIYYGNRWLPVGGEWLAVALLWFVGYTAILLLANLGSARELHKYEGLVNAQHLQALFSLAYVPAVVVSACPAAYCAMLLFRPELGFGDHFPVETMQQTRGVYHAVLDDVLPEQISLESLRAAEDPRLTPWATFLFAATIAMLFPVTVHLYSLLFFPTYAAPEKVLDSQYKYVRVPTSPPPTPAEEAGETFDFSTQTESEQDDVGKYSNDGETSSTSKSHKRGKKKGAKRKQTTTTGADDCLVSGSERADGALEFDDSTYIRESSFRMVNFGDGDAVQVDDLHDEGLSRELSPDAVPLIETASSTSADGSSLVCELHQRVRSAVHVFPESSMFRAVLGALAAAALLLDPAHVFVIQILSAAVAVSCLVMRWDGGATERTERKLVPRTAAKKRDSL
ncbi:GPI inositol-deacylase [Hondaea fermentalgiana]|uniref:GPI inositol-deacylase n=1 Tax=Hondaea fermentalgiana TaxID=2315210 RepID=A0A2R5GMK0_9STRA|nr:GPI inositol-deacylase [Hondaea fermentalgiana]|eukprot:GBG31855.1 GPI inositol-deacylase [Hondaea fermentalgiana]